MAAENINSLLSSVPKLSADNYQDWKFAVQMVMRRAGCLSVANGTEERPTTREKSDQWDKSAEQALTIIGLTVNPDQYHYIRDAKNGPEAWSALRGVYEKNSRANRIALKREFYTTAHDPRAPIREYTNRVTDLANRLKAIGVSLRDDDVIDVLIYNLHPSWASIASTLSAAPGTLKLLDVIGALVDEEARRAPDSSPDATDPDDTALVSRQPRRSRQNDPKFRNAPGSCYACNKPGHIARDCPNRPAVANLATDSDSEPELVLSGTIW